MQNRYIQTLCGVDGGIPATVKDIFSCSGIVHFEEFVRRWNPGKQSRACNGSGRADFTGKS